MGQNKLGTRVGAKNSTDFETNTPSYNLLNAGFGGEMSLFKNPLQIQVSGTNLTNKTYVNHLSRLKLDGINNIGRNFIISLNYTL